MTKAFEPSTDELLQGILNEQDNNCNHADWARRELELAGLFREDSDYGGMIGQSCYDIVRLFSRQEHSGFSAMWVADLVDKLLRFEPITENDHSLYQDVTDQSFSKEDIANGKTMWQCSRDSRYFSEDSGKTWSNVEDKHND